MPQSDRITLLQQRATPSAIARNRGTQEHADLMNALDRGARGKLLEPGPDHPLYDDFIRLTEPRPKGRPPVLPQDPESKAQRARENAQRYRQNTWTREQQDAKNQHDREVRARSLRIQRAKQFYGIDDQDAAEMLADQHQFGGFPPPLTTQQYEQEGKTRWWPYEYGKGIPFEGAPVHDAFGVRVTHVLQRAAADTWDESRIAAATKAKKPKPPPKPEEMWDYVHRHPEGVPGGMGKAPEYHLRNRGWSSHEIHGATNKTIQYHNPSYPDFVISFGGANSTKPDHNFGITYMGTNTNIPKKHRAYSVAEAMNKVEELHQMQAGHVVLPMTHDSAVTTPLPPSLQRNQPGTSVPKTPKPRDMDKADSYPDFPSKPEGVSDAWNDRHEKQLQEIPDPPIDHPPRHQVQASLLDWARRESWES